MTNARRWLERVNLFSMNNLELKELSVQEMKENNGGGWIADFVERFLCALKCNPYPSTMYHNTMMMRGI
ncbi:hypothetical protein CDL62_09240 [Alkalitalea saponilacus]|nr:hypothetical protein CDL62_09240 [Alkalitalea saponilacus]